MFEQLEQQAAGKRAEAAVLPAAEASPVPARQLTFTPTTGGLLAVGKPGVVGATPLSSGGRSSRQPTSHLGRSALSLAAAAVSTAEDAELALELPEQGQGQSPLAQGLEHPSASPLPPAPEHPLLGQHGPTSQPAVLAGQKRSLAAAAALEQVAAQYPPAAAKLQQEQLLAGGSPGQGPVWKRLRSAAPAHEHPSQLRPEAAGAEPKAAPLQAPTQAGPTAAAVDAAASFDYRETGWLPDLLSDLLSSMIFASSISLLVRRARPPASSRSPAVCSDDESEDEEADRNLPLLTQYMQSAGRSPEQAQGKQQEGHRRASKTLGKEAGSPARAEDASPGLSAQPTQGTASPLQSADPGILGG